VLERIERAAHSADSGALGDYGTGYDLGARWAADRASADELKVVASYAHVSWFRLDLRGVHSLQPWLASELGDGWANPDGRGLRREPLVEGLVAGAASVHDARSSRARPR
jgi:hypothetical protein